MKNIIWYGTSDDSRYAELGPGVTANIHKRDGKYYWKVRKEGVVVGEGSAASMKASINRVTKIGGDWLNCGAGN